MSKLKIIFAGGGTGGHLFPALAIADRLKEMIKPDQADFRFVGTKRGIEYRMKDKLGYPLSLINIRGLSRAGIMKNILFPVLLFTSMFKSIYLMFRYKPDMVVGTGGYVMGPVMMAAIALYKRTVIQEQNSYPGLTTRKLAIRVDRVFLGFEDAKKHLPYLATTVITGNPVKTVFGSVSKAEARKFYGLSDTDKVILVLGGSQGASSINQNILDNIKSVGENYRLIWQTGKLNLDEIKSALGENADKHIIFDFSDNIEYAYSAADLAIARAGALTLAELEASSLPAILIPYPHAAEDHQTKNAESFAKDNSAVIVSDSELKEYNVPAFAIDLIESGKIVTMTEAVRKKNKERQARATDLIAEQILELIDWKGRND